MEASFEPERWSGLQDLERDLRDYLARRCRDASEADDVLQETFLRAARYRHALTEPSRLRGWAVRIATNILRDHQRRQCRLPRAELGEYGVESLVGREPDPSAPEDEGHLRVGADWLPREVALRELEQAVCELRPKDRQVLDAYYRGGQCGERTARECGLPRNLVKVRLFRARRRLEQGLRLRLVGPRAATREACGW